MFTLAKRSEFKTVISPHFDHNYWKERVNMENGEKKNRSRTISGDFRLTQNPKYPVNTRSVGKNIFTDDLVHIFTGFVNSKAKTDLIVASPQRTKPATALNWTRKNNGGHIPVEALIPYQDQFAKRSYIKPNQPKTDSTELGNIIDDIKTDSRLTFSKKKQLISLAFKYS